VKLKEQGRVVLCHISLCQVVQRYIFPPQVLILRERTQHGRFARLPRSGQKDRGVGFAQFKDAGFHVSSDVFHKAPPFSADFVSGYIIADK